MHIRVSLGRSSVLRVDLACKKEFEKFHGSGVVGSLCRMVRTISFAYSPGSPSHNISLLIVRMLSKYSYRHVYISRKFFMKHALIPADARLGQYGYSGLVNVEVWPITLAPSSSFAHTPLWIAPGSHKIQKEADVGLGLLVRGTPL
jgi:hypothetical protein